MRDRLRRIRDERKELQRLPTQSSLTSHMSEIMRDPELGHVRRMVQQSMEAIDRDIQTTVGRLRSVAEATAHYPDVIPMPRDRCRLALLNRVKEKLVQQRIESRTPESRTPRVGYRELRHRDDGVQERLRRLQITQLPSVTLAAPSTGAQPQQVVMQDYRNVSIQTDPSPELSEAMSLPVAMEIVPEDVISVVNDILHTQIDFALADFNPLAIKSNVDHRLAIDICTQTEAFQSHTADEAPIKMTRRSKDVATATESGATNRDRATATEYPVLRHVATSPQSDVPSTPSPPPCQLGNALDSEDSEGWLTPPRIASTATPLDASELDALRNRDFRLCLSPLPESLPELLAQLIDEDNVSPVPTHPLKVDSTMSSSTISSSNTQTSSSSISLSTEGGACSSLLSEGQVLFRVASPGQIIEPNDTYDQLTQESDRWQSSTSISHGQLVLPFPVDNGAGDRSTDIDPQQPVDSSSSTSSFRSLPAQHSSGQVLTTSDDDDDVISHHSD